MAKHILMPAAAYVIMAQLQRTLVTPDTPLLDKADIRTRMRRIACALAAPGLSPSPRINASQAFLLDLRTQNLVLAASDATLGVDLLRAVDEVTAHGR